MALTCEECTFSFLPVVSTFKMQMYTTAKEGTTNANFQPNLSCYYFLLNKGHWQNIEKQANQGIFNLLLLQTSRMFYNFEKFIVWILFTWKGRHCCSVELLQCRGAENYLCQHLQPWLQRFSVSVLFLVLDFPLGAPYYCCLGAYLSVVTICY